METNLKEQLNRIIERTSRATKLDNLIQGYRLYAQTEGKSPKTIEITTTAVTAFGDFLDFFASVFPKVVLEQAAMHRWIVEYRGVFAYSRGRARPMLSTVCHFRRPAPEEERELTNIPLIKNMDEAAKIISEGIVNVDKHLECDDIRRRIQEDLDSVVHLRDQATAMP